ncbi:MAG: hypothetical protein RJA78_267 [Actinomycetota bacterium]|jgi:hypothetical protein
MSDQQKPDTKTVTGKGRPTPTRKEREAANKRPLVGNRSKEAREAARQAQRAEREKARKLAIAGDERYLLPRDRGPQRKIIRDVLDNRYTLIEGLMPLMVLFLVVTSFIDDRGKDVVTVVMILALFSVTLEAAIINRKSTATIREKLGEDTKLQRGNYFYTITRGMQPRPLRLPKPGPRRSSK